MDASQRLVSGQHEPTHHVLVELFVVVVGQRRGALCPKRFGRVDLAGIAHDLALVVPDLDLDRVQHVVAVSPDDLLETIALKELFGVVFERQLDACAALLADAIGDGEPAVAGGRPQHCFVSGPRRHAVHLDRIGHHEATVEAHAELADETQIAFLSFGPIRGGLFQELQRSRMRDGPEVFGRLLARHADAHVLDDEHATTNVGGDADLELEVFAGQRVVDKRFEPGLVQRVGRVGDELAQENLAVGVQRVRNELQNGGDFGFELELFGGRCGLRHRRTSWNRRYRKPSDRAVNRPWTISAVDVVCFSA